MSGSLAVIDRPRLPALFMSWAAGIAAVAAHRDDLLATLFSLERVPEPGRNELIPAVLAASPELIHAGDDIARLYRIYRPVFVNHLSLGRDSFIEAWERWQYLLFLAGWDLRQRENTGVHLSTAGIRVYGYQPVLPVPYRWALGQAHRLGEDHPLLRAGFFGGEQEGLVAAIEASAEELASSAKQADWQLIPADGAGMLPSGRHYPGMFTDDPDIAFAPPQ